MSKAFDSINHEIILAKLKNVGLSYDKLPVVNGVPRGSTLGLLLFSTYETIYGRASSSVPQSHMLMTLNYFCFSISIPQVLQYLTLMEI